MPRAMLVQDRAARGVVYTPREVCEPMVRTAIEPLLRGRSADDMLALRVCDPATGDGAFVRATIDVIAEHVIETWRAGDRSAPPDRSTWNARARRSAARCVFGVDIDRDAVAHARTTGANIRVGDALDHAWQSEPPFDAVIANPPYIRQERLGDKKPALRGFASYDGVADLYVYFIELAHRLVRPGGRYCLIVPNKWLTAAYGRPLRRFLAEQRSLEGIVDLASAPVFGDADAFPCIVWGTIGGTNRGPIRTARVTDARKLGTAIVRPEGEQPRERWTEAPWHLDAPGDRRLLDRLERSWPRLSDVVRERPARGVVTGCNRAFVIDAATRERLVAEDPRAEELIRPLVRGRDVRAWSPAAAERWVLLIDRGTDLDEYPAIRRHLNEYKAALEPRPLRHTGPWHGRKPGSYRWFELQDPVGPLVKSRAPRLLYQDIQTAPMCSLDSRGDLVPDTTVWMLPTADRFLLAVLNSQLYAWYARRRFPPALNGAVRPKLEYMSGLPVATPSRDLRDHVEQLVDRLVTCPAALTGSGANHGDHEVARQRAALDRAIAESYGLSASEQRLIRNP